MSLKTACPHCEKVLKVSSKAAGQTLPCPACNQPVRIPAEVESLDELQPVRTPGTPMPPPLPAAGGGAQASPPPPPLPDGPPPLPQQASGIWQMQRGTLFTNPRFPGWANAICIYCIVVVPALWLLGLLFQLVSPTQISEDSPARAVYILTVFISQLVSLGIMIGLVLGGLGFKQATASGLRLVKIALWVHFGYLVIESLVGLLLAGIIAGMDPTAFSAVAESTTAKMAILGLFAFALILAEAAFDIVALNWLYRHGNRLPLVHN